MSIIIDYIHIHREIILLAIQPTDNDINRNHKRTKEKKKKTTLFSLFINCPQKIVIRHSTINSIHSGFHHVCGWSLYVQIKSISLAVE